MKTRRRWVLAGVLAAIVGLVIVAGQLRRYRAKPVAPHVQSVVLCETAGVELVDSRCDRNGTCDRRSTRLTWHRGEGTLFIGEGEVETSRPVGAVELSRLREALTEVDARDADAMIHCGGLWGNRCPPGASTQTITTSCGSTPQSETFTRVPPLVERVRNSTQWCGAAAGWRRAKCLADAIWKATFVTERADRINRVMATLREAAGPAAD